jgi:hypothetical protein
MGRSTMRYSEGMSKPADNSRAVRKMPKGRPFTKGQPSANPGGRPKLQAKVKEYLEAHADEMTIEGLEALRYWTNRRGKSDGKTSVPAALGLLKKTLPDGAVKVQLEVSGPEGGPVETKVVALDDSPGSLARVVEVLRVAGVLETGDGEGADAEADEVHPPASD